MTCFCRWALTLGLFGCLRGTIGLSATGLLGLGLFALKLNMLSLRSPSLLLRLSVMVERDWNGTESCTQEGVRIAAGVTGKLP